MPASTNNCFRYPQAAGNRASSRPAIGHTHGRSSSETDALFTSSCRTITTRSILTIGSASRNPVHGPSYRSVDLALIRRVPVAGGSMMEARVEVFNLLNTPNFGAPNAIQGAANFGTITSALDPRVVQLALKFLF